MALSPLNKTFTPSRKQISYLNKSFDDYQSSLQNFVKTYFPQTYSDFSAGSPGSIFIDLASYVGDVLGYYIDSNFRENLLPFTTEISNIIPLAQSFGYQPKPATAATVNADIFQLVPAQGISANYAPDPRFYIRLSPDAVFATEDFGAINFRTIDEVNFGDPTDRELTVYSIDAFNRPTFYLVKKTVQLVAGTIKTFTANFTTPQRFATVTIPDQNVLDVISVIDGNGATWSQVDYLAQDLILNSILNTNSSTSNTSSSIPPTYNLQIVSTPKRFVVRYDDQFQCELDFGSGVLDDTDVTINLEPTKIANSEYQTNLGSTTLDPSDFLSSKSYGQAPVGELTITYATGGGIESNVPSNTITRVVTVDVLNDPSIFNPQELSVWNSVKQSIAVNNSEPASGGKGQDSVEEIRQNAIAFFNAQNRCVTANDYVVRTYAMPPKFGGVAKAFVVQDEQINNILRDTQGQAPIGGEFVIDTPGPGIINLYVLGFNQDKQLVTLNDSTKQNLATYLDQFRILTENVRILDAFIITIGVDFRITVFKNFNMQDTLAQCLSQLQDFFNVDNWNIGQPLILNDLYMTIASVEGVQSVLSVTVSNKYAFQDGAGYSPFLYDIQNATVDGVIYTSADPSIFFVQNPDIDLRGGAQQ